ncbi:hypothetical protein EYF80_049422 [Liparis tanakae]|uniref:Uncharacterized protein n=1 Tax=Liparis tanakae TaxID=230148 RepID=A0A4Z2FGU8_9TELE|nr:hypothetical protein EYF80_049422 [Liparis tanakae]
MRKESLRKFLPQNRQDLSPRGGCSRPTKTSTPSLAVPADGGRLWSASGSESASPSPSSSSEASASAHGPMNSSTCSSLIGGCFGISVSSGTRTTSSFMPCCRDEEGSSAGTRLDDQLLELLLQLADFSLGADCVFFVIRDRLLDEPKYFLHGRFQPLVDPQSEQPRARHAGDEHRRKHGTGRFPPRKLH